MLCFKVAVVCDIVNVVGIFIWKEVLTWRMCSLSYLSETDWKVGRVKVFMFLGLVGWSC